LDEQKRVYIRPGGFKALRQGGVFFFGLGVLFMGIAKVRGK